MDVVINRLALFLRRRHRRVGATPELRQAALDYLEGYAGTYGSAECDCSRNWMVCQRPTCPHRQT
jgi:hypothetical protein